MKENKKILLVSNTAWSLANFRMSLALFLKNKGYGVQFLAPDDNYKDTLISNGFKFNSIKIDNKGSNPLNDFLLLVSFWFKYYTIKPDLIIHYTIKPNIYGSIAAYFLRIKSIAVVTGLGYAFIQRGWTTKLVMKLYKISFGLSSKVLFLNETDRTFFCRLKIVNREKTIVIPGEGINMTFFSPAEEKVIKPFTFLFIGRLLKDKGLLELIDATRELKKLNIVVKVQLVGFLDALNPTAISENELNSWIAEGLIEYLGPQTDVRNSISGASCIVLPSYREGIPRTLLEASSMAKPIITTNVVGCKDVVIDPKTGILCEVKNFKSLQQAMMKMMDLPESQLKMMGEEGRNFISENFSEEHVFSIYEDLTNQLFPKNEINYHRTLHTNFKISVITVVLNNRLFVKDAIESVLNQTYKNIEYIVIDGGSTDGSIDIIQSYKNKLSTVISEPDEGIYDAMNKGLALATGDIIGFLNADDFYASSAVIEQIVNRFNATQAQVVYADLDYIARADKNKIVRKWRSGDFSINRFKKGWMPPHPTFFAKRELYQNYGGYKQVLHSSADYELMLRFCYVNKARVAYLPQVLVKMRLGGQSNRSFKNRLLANLQDRKAWEINRLKPAWYTFFIKPLSKIKQYFI